ncbi:hypothetical protein K1T71_009835 [Dendrolimus kikuchii]|uniref:Uncharacterized protein n=1 Tax=Dendrolimus kikuchii TaxID=765133 RepID=A0ACC1CTW6_9NEOP|nr:hypothetical protein K1T71_009835 [Dendrolimus kikuchii]
MDCLFGSVVLILLFSINKGNCNSCNVECPPGNTEMQCGFDAKGKMYKMFPSQCALDAYIQCYDVQLVQTHRYFCVKADMTATRRAYGESCPVFCPNYYRPVCGASKYRSYIYRTFTNGCYLDMLNCRGDDDYTGYVEVPLEFCQKHAMKNIYKEQVVVTNLNDYDYDFNAHF